MLTGTVVAARMKKSESIGSSNFVLLKHSLPMPKEGDDPESPTRMTLFSLYMHLEDPDSPPRRKATPVDGEGSQGNGQQQCGNRSGRGRGQQPRLGTRGEDDRPFARVGYGNALSRGDVTLLPVSGAEAIRVGSGEVIGAVGQFGAGLDRTGPRRVFR